MNTRSSSARRIATLSALLVCASAIAPSVSISVEISISRQPDVVIYGATAPGITAAVRCAREGLQVALVSPTRGLGGSFPSLGAVETHYRGVRAPLLQEFCDRVTSHYLKRYGPESEPYRQCIGGPMIKFEPHVAEAILAAWLAAEPRIQVFHEYRPEHVERAGRDLRAVTFRRVVDDAPLRLQAAAYVDASDEGDLMALAGAKSRIGRESRREFNEPRAGRVFTQWLTGRYPRDAVEGRLNLVTYGATTSEPLPPSTGAGDDNIQSYSVRLCLTDDPENRLLLDSPPADYDRKTYAPILLSPNDKAKLPLPFHHRFLIYSLQDMAALDHVFHGHALPNRKRSWNATNLTGGGKKYPEANWTERERILRQHYDFALGLLYFLQHDAEMPADLQAEARRWGLARDEFASTVHRPPVYIRETRRLVGRRIFTEHDALITPGLGRAPLHADSVGVTEFSLDSLACTTERVPGSLCDGQLFQMEVSRPGQIAFGVMLPQDIDNLLVATTASATHVGWGTVRQTPTLMHLAESAAWAIVSAAEAKVPPALLNIEMLQRRLVEHGIMITFFNDIDMSCREPWLPAVQFMGTRGFFPTYDAKPNELLTMPVARHWARCFGQMTVTQIDPTALARELFATRNDGSANVRAADFLRLLIEEIGSDTACLKRVEKTMTDLKLPTDAPLTRAAACRWMYQSLN